MKAREQQSIRDAVELAKQELNKWGFGVPVVITSKVRTLGSAQFKNYKPHAMQLSRYLILNRPDQLLDTIRHEIAHFMAGSDNGHNEVWRSCAVKVGARPEQFAEGQLVEHSYKLMCQSCGEVVQGFYRKPRKSFQRAYHTPCGEASLGKLLLLRNGN